jgi:carbamoyl-phosphate synthase small subunit
VKATLVLADGTTFEGESIGAYGTSFGETVFSTSMTGYQEMLTDPSFAGQLLTLTYPLVGNYGVTPADFESDRVQVNGFIVRELCEMPSSWRSGTTLQEFLTEHNVVGIQGIDTRALTRRLRVSGVMMGGISTEYSREELLQQLADAPNYSQIDFVRRVTAPKTYVWEGDMGSKEAEKGKAAGELYANNLATREKRPETHIALVDCGVKRNIMRNLAALNCKITVFPCDASAEEILEVDPKGVVISPGPGDPELLGYMVDTVKGLIGKKPILGICLGNQLLGRAFGGRTFKLKFGHRGGNHPVKDNRTGRVYITSQNHGYAVDAESLDPKSGMEVAHINMNDGTVEGMRHRELPIFSIQYHPEASPGPRDSGYLFNEFFERVVG